MLKNKLFLIPRPNVNAKIRLFCLPYAGGSASTYISWAKSFDHGVELVLIQPPGRASRMNEPPHRKMAALVDEIIQKAGFITSRPYLIFGHSLGSRVAYEMVCRMAIAGLPLPECLIASGSRAPHTQKERKNIYNLPQDQFILELKKLNGTPNEVLANPELLELVTPLLRADFEIADTHTAEPIIIKSPIHVFGGQDDDDVSLDQLKAWKELAGGEFNLETIPGDHFFINDKRQLIIDKIQRIIEKYRGVKSEDVNLTV